MCLQQLQVLVDLALCCNCELSHVWSHSVSPCNATHGHCVGRCVCVRSYWGTFPCATQKHHSTSWFNPNWPFREQKHTLPWTFFSFLLVIGFLLLFIPLPFVLPATFNLVTCLFSPYPRPLLWQSGGLLKVEGKVWQAFIKWARRKDWLAG